MQKTNFELSAFRVTKLKGKGGRKTLLDEDKIRPRQANDEGNCRYRMKGPPWSRKIEKII